MNERIREFKEQAMEWVPNMADPNTKIRLLNAEKFAQLIVAECAKTAYLYASDNENYKHYDDLGWDCLPGDLQSHIKEHFGVEE